MVLREPLGFDWRPIGATDTAVATRELLNAIPLENEQISGGFADWIDTQPGIVNKARELGDGLNEVDQTIWDSMKDATSDFPDLEIPTRTELMVASVTGLLRSSGDGSA